jgi:hypothetical protein
MLSKIRNLLKSWFSFLITFSPSNSDVDELLAKIEKVLSQLTGKVDADYWKTKLKDLKVDIGTRAGAKDKIPMKDGKVDKETWESKPKEEKLKLWEFIDTAFNELRYFNRNRLICGEVYFVMFLLLLLAILGIYHHLHTGWLELGGKLSPKLTMDLDPKETTPILEELRTVELKLGEAKAKKEKSGMSDVKKELDKLRRALENLKSKTPLLSLTTSRLFGRFSAEVEAENEAAYQRYRAFLKRLEGDLKGLSRDETMTIWKEARKVELKLGEAEAKKGKMKLSDVKPDVKELQSAIDKKEPVTFPFETARLLGVLSAEVNTNDLSAHQTVQDFSKKLRADLESFSTPYFWTTSPWRWYELFFWALIGCLVGLLFYIAGLLSQGVFNTEEVFMFWAELFIAPIVVLVVFFLFTFTGITSFTPSETSLTVSIGFAFILGFAVRRTIGLLDTLKKRIFPEPSPEKPSPGT